jgi:molybdenum cofactor synthesis domain-containing protein
VPSAAIVTIGNEIVSGDVENTNASWLARRLEALGVTVALMAAIRDEIETIGDFVRAQSLAFDHVVVTGGLGGTPDDVTRQGLAAAFRVGRTVQEDVARRLRERFVRAPEYAALWALLPDGSRPLENPLGGAPGFSIENVFVLPGLPAEMEEMFETIADELRAASPIQSWRHVYRTRESTIVSVLEQCGELHPAVSVGSYPSFRADGPEVEVVVKASDPNALAAASGWIAAELARVVGAYPERG